MTNGIKVPDEDHPITIDADTARVVARVGGAVIADTSAALTLREAGYSPVHYIPLDDVVPGMPRPSTSRSYCPYKGEASYYDVVLPNGTELLTSPGPTRLPSRRWMPSPAVWPSTPTASRLKRKRWPQRSVHTSGSDDRLRARHEPDRGPRKHRNVAHNAKAPVDCGSGADPPGRLLADGCCDCDRHCRVERPEPPYPVYQAQYKFSEVTLTAVFAIYVFALMMSLLTVGRLSDYVGRRVVLAGALVVEAGAMGLFVGSDGVGWLLWARIVQGFATGAAFGAAARTYRPAAKRPVAIGRSCEHRRPDLRYRAGTDPHGRVGPRRIRPG